MLKKMGANEITIYHSGNSHKLKKEMQKYDVIVHAACSYYEILSKNDLKRMKHGALLIHLGSDSIGGDFDANSIYSPVEGINNEKNLVYCINHVPTLAYKTASEYISRDVAPYIDTLSKGRMNKTLKDAVVMDKGKFIF